MDFHYAARLIAVGRIGIGAVLLALPGLIARRLGAPMTKRMLLLTRVMAIRDLVIGLGTFKALSDGSPAAPWIRAGAAADAVDAAAVLMAADEFGPAATVAGVAIASTTAALGFRAAAELAD